MVCVGKIADVQEEGMDEMYKSWDDFTKTRFPSNCIGKTVSGINLATLDVTIAGCITTFIGNDDQLDQAHKEILEGCIGNLEKVISELQGDEQDYFNQLYKFSKDALGKLSASG